MFRIITQGADFTEYVLLKSGQGLMIRAAKPEDRSLVRAFMGRISRESLRMRYMASISYVSDQMIGFLCDVDFSTDGCLLAITGDGPDLKVVGVGNYNGLGNGRTAEVSFLIEDDYQGQGISTLLLERLAGLAAASGYVEFEAEVLPENLSMINVFKSSGFENHHVWHSDRVHVELPVSGAAALWKRANLRERLAVANSLKPILHPGSIAVLGASRDSKSIGHMIFCNILNGNFSGTVYPVNPQADSVKGVKAYRSVEELPEGIDLAVIAVPAEHVYQAVEKAIAAGAKGVLVVSAGFAESGIDGTLRQEKLLALVRSHGVRLVGPSCLGVMNTHPDVGLNASLAPHIMDPGHTAFFSHSAALGLVILNYADEIGISFSTFVSAGNRADVSGNDLLQYWEEDPNTHMVILYLETFGNPRKFTRIARRMSYKKPILCVKSARSRVGRVTAEAKTTGSRSGDSNKLEALFIQTGVILTETLEELFDVALVLSSQELPRGNRVSVIANSAGMATIFADACDANALELSSDGLVNLGAFTSPDHYQDAVRERLIQDDVDALLVGYACVGDCTEMPVALSILRGAEEARQVTGMVKPVLLCLMGRTGAMALEDEGIALRVFPAFRFPEAAARALGKIVRYSEFRKRKAGKLQWYDDMDADSARKWIQYLLEDGSGHQKGDLFSLDEAQSCELLGFFKLNMHGDSTEAGNRIMISIEPDPLFGPLIRIEKDSGETIFRITPLTQSDIEETTLLLNCSEKDTLADFIGRTSQMIEELPWLWQLECELWIDKEGHHLIRQEIILKSGGTDRPGY